MPVSKNRRKNKKGQSRKVNKAKAANNQGIGGFADVGMPPVEYEPPLFQPQAGIPGLRTVGMNVVGSHRYRVTSPPDDPDLSEMEQIDAIMERSIAFEMTEAHHNNIGLGDFDLDGEFEGGDIMGPMVARVDVDPLATIEGHPEWKTGQELIDFLDADPNVFRGEFDGNRWQGSGAMWDECPPSVLDCPYRVAAEAPGNAPECVQCETELRPEETHFHILDEGSILAMCESCWKKGPLPEENQTLGAKVNGRH